MIEHIWQATYRRSFRGGGPAFNAALGGIDVALWDIRGKLLGEPIWKLLGGPLREKIRVYTHFGGRTPAETAEQAERLVATGFRALKMVPHVPNGRAWGSQPVREIPRHLHAARQAVGADVDLMVDANGFSLALAPEAARELEALHLLWVEEPALPEHTEALRRISEETSLPIATGQHLYTLWGFREVFQKEIAAVIQPDMVHAGGISQLRKIAIMAEAYYVAMAPHNALSPVTTAACLHLDAAIPNFLIQEVVHGNHDRASVLNEPVEKVTDGHIPLPTRPGLGVELDEATVTRLGYT
jgi:galactonate dehydratase